MGEAPISHVELQSWQHNTGIDLDPWEARLLKRLSVEYLDEANKAAAPDRPAPWLDAPYYRAALSLKAQSLKNSIKELTKL